MASDHVVKFMHALQRLEQTSSVRAMAELFSPAAELSSPMRATPLRGIHGVFEFWSEYSFSFKDMHTRFTRVFESEDRAVLEWETEGHLFSGEEVRLVGVTLLDFKDERIVKYGTYFHHAPPGPGVLNRTGRVA